MEKNENGDEVFPLDDAAIAMIAELREQARIVPQLINASIQAVLQYFARTHNLKGQFQLAENGREIILRKGPADESYAEYKKRRDEATGVKQ